MYICIYICILQCIYIYMYIYINVFKYMQWHTCTLVLELESCGEDIFWKKLMTMNTLTFWSRLLPQNKTTFLCWKPLTFWWIVDDIPYSKGTVWGFMFFFHQLEFLLPQCWHSLPAARYVTLKHSADKAESCHSRIQSCICVVIHTYIYIYSPWN